MDDIFDAIDRYATGVMEQVAARTLPWDTAEENRLSCLSHWYPKIKSKVPTPDTTVVTVKEPSLLIEALDGTITSEFHALAAMLRIAIHRLLAKGGDKVFLRTGQGSGKHDWDSCCCVTNTSCLERHMARLIEWSLMVDMMGLPVDVWVAREFLKTEPVCVLKRYGNMPLVREFRYFVDGGRVLYRNPYWPDGAIEDGDPDRPWRDAVAEMNEDPGKEPFEMARACGDALGGRWSVDVLQASDGWFVTDMAVAERSFGWDESRAA